MSNFLFHYEPIIRVGFFFGILLLMALWEVLAPRRPWITSKKARWFCNLGVVLIDALALRLLFPLLAPGVAFHRGTREVSFESRRPAIGRVGNVWEAFSKTEN